MSTRKRNRKTLSDHFANGKLPSEEAFAELIESTVNIVDDGFDKSAQDGLKLAQLDNNSKLVSFYDEITVNDAQWSISFSQGSNGSTYKNLNFGYADVTSFTFARPSEDEPSEKIKVGINQNNPQHELDINGVLACNGRLGRAGVQQVLADGNWHPIISKLDGCQAFEIMAGVGKQHSGRYALMHAYALSTFKSRKSNISYHQAYFSSKCDQIELRWTGERHNYALEMRSRCSYLQNANEKIYIRYYLTQLWFDALMQDCLQTGNE